MTTSNQRSIDTFQIPGLHLQISRLGLGGAAIGGHGWGVRDDEAALDAIRLAAELGVTFFDTADVYGLGLAERLLCKGLADVPGAIERSIIATKGGVRWDDHGRTIRDSSPKYLYAAVEASMQRLKIDSIPLYYLHWPDGTTPVDESIGALCRLRDQGKIQAIGVSNILATDLGRLRSARIGAVQVKGNLLEPDQLFSTYQVAREIGAVVVCSSSLADGLLAGNITKDHIYTQDDHRTRYPLFQPDLLPEVLDRVGIVQEYARALRKSPAQIALRWLLETGVADAVLCGAKRPEQVIINTGAIGWELGQENIQSLAARVPLTTCDEFENWRRQITQ